MALPGGTERAPVYERSRLGAGLSIAGPAVVTQLDATALLPSGWCARVQAGGSLIVTDQ
jgi:N-methylhydantoinase A